MTVRCPEHPGVETNLSCAMCGKPICPRCMVETPVGMKCRGCARVRRHPSFEVSPAQYGVGAGVGAGAALAFGVAWGLVRVFFPLSGFLDFVLALAAGFGIAEVIRLSVRKKRGLGLAAVAGAGFVLCYFVGLMVPRLLGLHFGIGLWDIIYLAAGTAMAVNQIR